jgi:hypothetical protein
MRDNYEIKHRAPISIQGWFWSRRHGHYKSSGCRLTIRLLADTGDGCYCTIQPLIQAMCAKQNPPQNYSMDGMSSQPKNNCRTFRAARLQQKKTGSLTRTRYCATRWVDGNGISKAIFEVLCVYIKWSQTAF